MKFWIRLDFTPVSLISSIFIAYLFKTYPNDLTDSFNLKLKEDNLWKLTVSNLKKKIGYEHMDWLLEESPISPTKKINFNSNSKSSISKDFSSKKHYSRYYYNDIESNVRDDSCLGKIILYLLIQLIYR